MNALVPIPDPAGVRFVSADELRAHYKAVSRRLNRTSPELRVADVMEKREAKRTREEKFRAVFARAAEAHKPRATPRPICFRDIQRAVAEEFGTTINIMLSRIRRGPIFETRSAAIWLVKQMMPHTSLPQLGAWFGKRDHTCALNSIRRVEKRINAEPAFAERMAGLMAKIERAVG